MKKTLILLIFTCFSLNSFSQFSVNIKTGAGINNNIFIWNIGIKKVYYFSKSQKESDGIYKFQSKPAYFAGLVFNYKKNKSLNFSIEPNLFYKQTFIDDYNLFTGIPPYIDIYEKNLYLNIPVFYKMQIINRLSFKIGYYSEFLLKNYTSDSDGYFVSLYDYSKHNSGLSLGIEIEPIKKLFICAEFYADVTDYAYNEFNKMKFYNYSLMFSASYQIFSTKQ